MRVKCRPGQDGPLQAPARVEAGEEFEIVRSGVPVAELVPVEPLRPGSASVKIELAVGARNAGAGASAQERSRAGQRARIVLLAADELSNTEIAGRVGVAGVRPAAPPPGTRTRQRARSCCAWTRNPRSRRSIAPRRWLPGTPARATHDYDRNGTSSLYTVLDIATEKVIGSLHNRHRAIEFKRFLQKIDKEVLADLDAHLVLDNASSHKTAA